MLDLSEDASHLVEEGDFLSDLRQRELHLAPDIARNKELVCDVNSLGYAGHLSKMALFFEKLEDAQILYCCGTRGNCLLNGTNGPDKAIRVLILLEGHRVQSN